MPKQARYAVKQTLGSAHRELTKAQDKIVAVAALYEDAHADYFEAFKVVVQIVEQARLALDKLTQNI